MISSELDILETTLRDGNYVVDFQFTARDTGWLAGPPEIPAGSPVSSKPAG